MLSDTNYASRERIDLVGRNRGCFAHQRRGFFSFFFSCSLILLKYFCTCLETSFLFLACCVFACVCTCSLLKRIPNKAKQNKEEEERVVGCIQDSFFVFGLVTSYWFFLTV
eukprot:TRINITY_DN8516_c1_g2_i1.p1 TRINITY_DN8516_c1_g2~~TRINITY_DN8516_c1_g2_i1.p1  ORF type:complete len:129 (+),score=10.36 TRINITY_DN8516_c1_g2_i1:55-387(+)